MELGSTDLIINYVSLGYGISIIHDINIDAVRQDLHTRSLKAYYPRQYIYLVTRRGEELTPPVKGFSDLF
jgi:DNA-binding transcriptional LysR family regulator